MSATLLYVNVSYGTNEKNEIYVLTHIKSEDKSWCVNIKYKSLQDLDIKIEYYCKYIRHIAFPLIDKKIVSYFSNNVNENQNTLPPWKQMFIYDCYSKELQDYIHVLLQYQHIYPPDIKYMIRKMFSLPNGDFHDVKLENELKDDTILNEINDESNNNIKPSTSKFSKITKALTNITRRHSALTINNVNSLTNTDDDTNNDNKSYLSKAINKFHKNKNKQQPNKLLGIINSEKLITDLTIKEKSLLMVTVSRGIKGRQNQIEYEIKLECEAYEADSQPAELTIRRKYDDFRKLYKLLYNNKVKSIDSTDIKSLDDVSNKTDSSFDSFDNEIIADRDNTVFILSHFPNAPMIAMLGLKLSEKDLTYRTKLLDRWIREILSKYYLMNNQSRQIIRDFFNFDLSEGSQDIIIQDKLLQGLIVKQRAEARLHIPLYLLKNSDTEKWEKSSQLSGHSATLPVNSHNDNWNKYREDDSKSEASAYSSYSSYSNISTASKQSKIPNGTISVTLSNRITAAPINRTTSSNTNGNSNNNINNNNNNYNNSSNNISNRSMSISSEAPKEQSIFNESIITDENDSDINIVLLFHTDSNIKSNRIVNDIFIIKVINAKYYCSPGHFINPSAVTPNKDVTMNIWDKLTFHHTSYSQWPNNYINIKDIFDEKTLITIEDNKATLTRTFSNDNIDNYISNQKSNRTTSSSSNQPRRNSYSRSESGSPKPYRKKSNDVKKKGSPAQSVVSSASATSTRIGRPGHTVDRSGLLNIGM